MLGSDPQGAGGESEQWGKRSWGVSEDGVQSPGAWAAREVKATSPLERREGEEGAGTGTSRTGAGPSHRHGVLDPSHRHSPSVAGLGLL